MARTKGRRNPGRPQRVADQIQRELADLIRREVRDPRVGMVTLTAVEVSSDCAYATVLFSCLDPAQVPAAQIGLDHSAGFLRSQLARRITLYAAPELRFAYDESIERGARLSRLIDEANGRTGR
ncbi:MAG: 30S ribosome-binding factor RbfA [Proteobacteria bacterium]|nr:30S ribosome-binding factor RbfA [Pseudomonadota bacterium]